MQYEHGSQSCSPTGFPTDSDMSLGAVGICRESGGKNAEIRPIFLERLKKKAKIS
jgi:hypothetical protein